MSEEPKKWAVDIARRIAELHGVTWPEVLSKTRHRKVVMVRDIIAGVLRTCPALCKTHLSLPMIARVYGRKNHAITHAAVGRLKHARVEVLPSPDNQELLYQFDRTVAYLSECKDEPMDELPEAPPAPSDPLRFPPPRPIGSAAAVALSHETLELLRSVAGLPGARTHERTQQMNWALDLLGKWGRLTA